MLGCSVSINSIAFQLKPGSQCDIICEASYCFWRWKNSNYLEQIHILEALRLIIMKIHDRCFTSSLWYTIDLFFLLCSINTDKDASHINSSYTFHIGTPDVFQTSQIVGVDKKCYTSSNQHPAARIVVNKRQGIYIQFVGLQKYLLVFKEKIEKKALQLII